MRTAKGITSKEALKMLGWKAISFQQVAKNAGVKLKIDKSKGRPFTYRVKEVQKKKSHAPVPPMQT